MVPSKGKTSPVPGTVFSLSGVTAGAHSLKCEKEGYETLVMDGIKVTDDMPAIVPGIIMTKIGAKVGTITVKGKPDKADVKIEGSEGSQKAPCSLKDVPAGETTLIITSEGFKEKKQKVTLKPGEEKEVTYKLEKNK